MKREQIINLKGKISQAVADDRISQRCAVEIMNDIDAILALPIDAPSEEEKEKILIDFANKLTKDFNEDKTDQSQIGFSTDLDINE